MNADDLRTLSKLWDDGQAVPLADRPRWIDNLEGIGPELREALRIALSEASTGTQEGLLDTRTPMAILRASLAQDQPEATQGERIGAYRIVGLLGRGGMSTVWRAERADGIISRQVALKFPHTLIGDPQSLAGFRRECEILASLSHPSIARLYDVGFADSGQPYLAIELVEGRPITQYCDDLRLTLPQRLALFTQVLEAVQFAHENNVVHRDLKPSNILVTNDGSARLLDFGVARLLLQAESAAHAANATLPGRMPLTPSYASPEQVAGDEVGYASDVYSLGVLLYEILTGARPYRPGGPTRAQMLEAVLQADVLPASRQHSLAGHAPKVQCTPRALVAALRGNLDAVLESALARSPADRYASVGAMLADIRRHLAGERVAARSRSLAYRTWRSVYRYRIALGTALIVFGGLAAGLAAARSEARKAEIAEAAAREQARTAEAALQYLEGIFNANKLHLQDDPEKARNTTARELLDIGASHIEDSLEDAPKARLRLYRTMANLYGNLGMDEQILALERSRLRLARSAQGNSPADALDALLAMANFLVDSPEGRADGIGYLKEAQVLLDHSSAPPDEIRRMRAWAETLWATALADSDTASGRAHALKAVELAASEPGATLNVARSTAAEYDLQLGYVKSAIEIMDSVLSGDPNGSSDMISLYAWRCGARIELGDFGGLADCERTVRFREKSVPGSLTLAASAEWLAFEQIRASRLAEAQATLRRLDRTLQDRAEGDALAIRESVAAALVFISTERGALSLARAQVRALDERHRRNEHGQTLSDAAFSAVSRGSLLAEQGRYPEARKIVEDHIDALAKAGWSTTGSMSRLVSLLGRIHLMGHQPDLAAKLVLAHDARFPAEVATIPLSLRAVERDMLLAETALARGDPSQAAEQASHLLGSLTASPWASSRRLEILRIRHLLGASQLALGQAARAAATLGQALSEADDLLDRNSPLRAELLARLGSAELATGQRQLAESRLSEIEKIVRKAGAIAPHHGIAVQAMRRSLTAAQAAGPAGRSG